MSEMGKGKGKGKAMETVFIYIFICAIINRKFMQYSKKMRKYFLSIRYV